MFCYRDTVLLLLEKSTLLIVVSNQYWLILFSQYFKLYVMIFPSLHKLQVMPEIAFLPSKMHILGFIHKMSDMEQSHVFVALNESFFFSFFFFWECFFAGALSLSIWKVFCLPLQVLFAGINKCFPFLERWFK